MWNRLHARGLATSRGDTARRLLARVDLVELTPLVLARALDPFPLPLRTLDALHLATLIFLQGRGAAVRLATYDARLAAGANALGVPLLPL